MSGLHAVQRRRAVLQARSNLLRHRLAAQAQVLQPPLAAADRMQARVRWLLARPQWLGAIAGVAALLRPRKALGWGAKAWTVWRVWRQLRGR